MGVIFWFSSQPVIQTTDFFLADFVMKKTAHFVEYAILSVLVYRALIRSGIGSKKAIIISAVFSVIYAVSDEWHQSFVPGREPRLRDVVIDSFGAIFGLFLTKVSFRIHYAL
jgi:VanZ family protein